MVRHGRVVGYYTAALSGSGNGYASGELKATQPDGTQGEGQAAMGSVVRVDTQLVSGTITGHNGFVTRDDESSAPGTTDPDIYWNGATLGTASSSTRNTTTFDPNRHPIATSGPFYAGVAVTAAGAWEITVHVWILA